MNKLVAYFSATGSTARLAQALAAAADAELFEMVAEKAELTIVEIIGGDKPIGGHHT